MNLLKTLPSPIGLSREEIIDLLLKEEYGYLPSAPYSVTATVKSEDTKFCAGKAELLSLELTCKAKWGEFSFPVYYTRVKATNEKKHAFPCFVHINFRDNVPDKYQPTEELIDAGYSVLSFCYKDVSSDDGDFTNGLAGVVYKSGERSEYQCGKIGLWAYAACAVLEYALTLPEIDRTHISVVGHSRLGKTALLAGALDKRFFCAISNNSGCSGAALSRESKGETIADITRVFPFWFCKNYLKYAQNEDALPFDQHFLLAANANHKVYVASAIEDAWAYPKNEYLSCVAANDYFVSCGIDGFIHPDYIPEQPEKLHDGNIGYHLRVGTHYLGREDWQNFIEFLNSKQ